MSRLHIPWAHVDNVSIYNISISPAREDVADDNLNSPKQRKPSRDCCLNPPPQAQSATPKLHITPAIRLVKTAEWLLSATCLFDNTYWQVSSEEQGGRRSTQLARFKRDGCIM